MYDYKAEKLTFLDGLKDFASSLRHGYIIEPAEKQNWYPDFTFINKSNHEIKFAVDLKTTYRDDEHSGFCNGFTLGSHGEYFTEHDSTKNIQHSYSQYGEYRQHSIY